jgi:hypothetical protein
VPVRVLPEGEPYWLVRFTPEAAGEYAYRISAANRAGTASVAGKLTVLSATAVERGIEAAAPAAAPGPIGVSARDRRYFAFADGRGYFPLGLNYCWGQAPGGVTGPHGQLQRRRGADVEVHHLTARGHQPGHERPGQTVVAR